MSNKIDDLRAKRLLFSNMLYRCGFTVLKLFLNIYLFKLTNDIKIIAIFNIFHLFVYIISFDYFATIVKYKYRELVYSLSLLGLCFVSFLVMILGAKLPDYYLIIAAIFGVFNGMYWISYNNNEFLFTKVENRGNFQGLKSSLKTIISIIMPSIAGVIIGINYFGYGYEIVFGIGILFFILSLFIGLQKAEYGDKNKVSFIKGIKQIYKNKNLLKLNINKGLMEFSISTALIDILLPILIFSYGMGEMDLGFLLSFFPIISIIATYIFGKFIKYNSYKFLYNILSLSYIVSIVILLFFPALWYITIFSSIINIIFRIIYIPQTVFNFNTLSTIPEHKNLVSESMVLNETIATIAKMFIFTLIFLIGTFDIAGVKILFLLLAVTMFFSMILFSSIEEPNKN